LAGKQLPLCCAARWIRAIDEHLERMAVLDQAGRRNGSYPRHLLSELGDIELMVPRTRRFAPVAVVRAYARRPERVDRMILSCFVLGLSTRKVGEALLPILGWPMSPATVSTGAKQLDTVVAAFHIRPLKDGYRVVMLDGQRRTDLLAAQGFGLFACHDAGSVLVAQHDGEHPLGNRRVAGARECHRRSRS
jgi:hypothetical protein